MKPVDDQTLDAAEGIAPGAFDPDRVVFSYDRDSDTLMVHFYDRSLPGVSLHRGDGWYVRWDRDRNRPIGLQIEGFLARAARDEPDLLAALDLAELRGITLEEVARVRREVAQEQRRRDRAGIVRRFSRFWAVAAIDPSGAQSEPPS